MVRVFAPSLLVGTAFAVHPQKIADTHDSVSGFGKLDGFTFPRLGGDNADQTVFGGYVDAGSALLVYDSTGAGRLDGFNSTTTDAGGELLNGFGDFGLSSSNHPAGVPVVTFVSTAGGVDGVFLQMPSGVILRIADTATVWEPAGAPFYYLNEPAVAVSEDQTSVYVTFCARAGNTWRGILLATIPTEADGREDVELTTVADTNTRIPIGDVPVNFRCLTVPAPTPQGDVVFFGSNCGSSGSSFFIEQQWNKLAFTGMETRDANIFTKNRGSWYGASNVNPGIWRWGPDGSIIEVVHSQSNIPDGQPGERFVAFSDPGISLDGTAAFVGLGNNGSYGVFKGNRDKPLALVAGRQTPIPGYHGATFQNIPNVPSVGPNGEVVFFGAASSKEAGIFAENPHTGELEVVINYKAQVENQELLYIGFGTQAYSGGLATAYMVLNDTTCGVWNIPVENAMNKAVMV